VGWEAPYAAPITDPDDDAELVSAALAGDRRAVESLLRRHDDRLHALCRRMTGNDDDADDAAQEALVAIARGLAAGRFDGRSRFATWAYRVATNACLDELRRRRRRPQPASDEELELAGPPLSPHGGGDDVAQRVDVDAGLQRLSPEFRAAVVLRDLCGLDYAEIGDLLDLPPGTVRSRIARGRASLAQLLRNPVPRPERPTQSP
jgi:RNA polymerase sigma-70 factor (ECF subfamily)